MYQNRTSPTPSPLKNSATTARMRNLQPAIVDEDEDDEETLQLRLKALEARLKLKKLQQKKLRAATGASTHCEGGSKAELVSEFTTVAGHGKDHANLESLGTKARPSAAIQVTVSPQKRSGAKEARSPGRILLGIDKGLKGRNVSLKRPPNDQTRKDPLQDPFGRNVQRDIPRAISDLSAEGHCGKSKTFSEKIAEIRQQDKQHKERSNKLCKQRSAGFGVQQCDLEEFSIDN
jgi:minichromosome maintenance protein 10